MVTATRTVAPPGTSLKSLVNGFVLTKQTEGKSPRTAGFYSENLRRFLWYASKQDWSDDTRMLNEWHIREFLGYVANEKCRWGLEGNGSETSQEKASQSYCGSMHGERLKERTGIKGGGCIHRFRHTFALNQTSQSPGRSNGHL
jgi:hypothetical protein